MQCSPPGAYRGAIDILKKTIRNEVGSLFFTHALIACYTFASLGNLGSLQRCYATSGRLGCHRFSSPWLSSQLPPLSIATWYDGGSLWHERNAPYTCGTWCCWSVCWINKVCICISLCIYTGIYFRVVL